eukprot:2516013-Prymnesium_polylepis.1
MPPINRGCYRRRFQSAAAPIRSGYYQQQRLQSPSSTPPPHLLAQLLTTRRTSAACGLAPAAKLPALSGGTCDQPQADEHPRTCHAHGGLARSPDAHPHPRIPAQNPTASDVLSLPKIDTWRLPYPNSTRHYQQRLPSAAAPISSDFYQQRLLSAAAPISRCPYQQRLPSAAAPIRSGF